MIVVGGEKKTMRDAFLGEILTAMDNGEKVFFLSADLGAPALDKIRERHPDRFVNVGIAEQNLVNVATGIGLEGFTVYAYAIAPFITMRCYEQIRLNLAILSQVRELNVNLIGVGAGCSYDVSGPTHHCLEDLSIMRTLPNLEVISPADWVTASKLFRYSTEHKGPKYLRFDAKPLPAVHSDVTRTELEEGFKIISSGSDVCYVSTGYLTHRTKEIVARCQAQGRQVGHLDMIKAKGFDEDRLLDVLSKYRKIVTLEEGFIGAGGLDAAIGSLVLARGLSVRVQSYGLNDEYSFHIGGRDSVLAKAGLDIETIFRETSRTG